MNDMPLPTLPDALRFLDTLRPGDQVEYRQTADRQAVTLTVQPNNRGGSHPATSRSDGDHGSAESTGVTVGYGPGRWNRRVEACQLRDGLVALRRVGADQ